MLFSHISHTPKPQIKFLERLKMSLSISKVFGSRGGATEILTMISVQKYSFLFM